MNADSIVQNMPFLQLLVGAKYGPREWLTYYRNIWARNLTARLIDRQSDETAKKNNPDMPVQSDDGREIPVKQRLEHRKILVQDALNLIAAIDALLALDDAALAATYSEESLKVAPDMIPATPSPVVAPANTNLAKYKVLNESGIALADGSVGAKDSIVELDPSNPDTIRFVEGGFIVAEGAPTPAAQV